MIVDVLKKFKNRNIKNKIIILIKHNIKNRNT